MGLHWEESRDYPRRYFVDGIAVGHDVFEAHLIARNVSFRIERDGETTRHVERPALSETDRLRLELASRAPLRAPAAQHDVRALDLFRIANEPRLI